jgi:hypothetical protein
MEEKNANNPASPDQLSDILLVLDKEKTKIQAVKGIGKNGELETVDTDKKNAGDFLRVDKHGDVFSNFFSNFFKQLKNPARFEFFKVPALISMDVATELQKNIDQPSPEGATLAAKHKVETLHLSETKQEKNMETTQSTQKPTPKAGENTQKTPESGEYRYKPEQIDWETMNNLGLNKERLEKRNLLEPLLKGFKTNELVNISLNLGSAIVRTDARLSLQQNDNGQLVVAIHGIRKEPTLNFPFLGHEFSKEDKDNLLQKGNMGRIVDLKNPRTDEIIPSIISVDRLTNELVALRADKIKIPDEIKGVKLDDNQKQTLMEGKPLQLVGMISKKGEPFDASVQFNADKRYVEFLFDRTNSNQQSKTNGQKNQQSQPLEAPRIFRGKELDEQQYNKFSAGQTVYVDGLKDKKGQSYQGYITFNKDTAKTEFSFQNPDKLKTQAKPAETHKTQTAVNSEGKSNEATKNVKEPLSSAQQAPKNNKQQEQQEKPQAPAKSKGRKM